MFVTTLVTWKVTKLEELEWGPGGETETGKKFTFFWPYIYKLRILKIFHSG